MNLYKNGQVDAVTAMKMLAELAAPGKPHDASIAKKPSSSEETTLPRKRQRSPSRKRQRSPSPDEISDADVHDITGNHHLDSRLSLNFCHQNYFLKSLYHRAMCFLHHATSVTNMFFNLPTSWTEDEKEKNKLKAKLRRLCEKKRGGKLNVPQHVHDRWREGNHLDMALQWQSVGFSKEPSFHKISQCQLWSIILRIPRCV